MENTKKDSTESTQPSALDKLRDIKNINTYYKRFFLVLIARVDEASQLYGLQDNALAWVEEIEERYEGIDKKDQDRQKELFESLKEDILSDIAKLKNTKKGHKPSEEEVLREIQREGEEMRRVIQSSGNTESRRQRGHVGPKGGKQIGVKRVF